MSDNDAECCRVSLTWFGQSYLPRKKVDNINELSEGDHICCKVLSKMCWHHAIVETINNENEQNLHIIHYTKPAVFDNETNEGTTLTRSLAKPEVKRDKIFFPASYKIYLITDHYPLTCFPPKEVAIRARRKLEEKEYNLVTNNCEHFAMWCKTGDSTCNQVKIMRQVAKTTIQSAVAHQVVTKSKKVLGEETGVALEAAIVGTFAILSEVTFAIYDNCTAKAKLAAKEITVEEYNYSFNKRVKAGACNVTGLVVGCVIGRLVIPIPGIGSAIGIAVGSCGASMLGNVYF